MKDMIYKLLICVVGFIVGYLLLPMANLHPAFLIVGIPTVLIAIAVRYLIVGNAIVKRFMLGILFTVSLAFIPASTVSAISIWALGNYDIKTGAFGTWILFNMIFVAITLASAIGFTIWSTLLVRIAHRQPIWCYFLVVAAPVAGSYTLIYTGVLELALRRISLTGSLFDYIIIGLLAYSPGIILSAIISLTWRLANKSVDHYVSLAADGG